MATLYIDNQPYEVKEGNNLLDECLTLGFNVPFFCWHPALGSVGACRLCAVKQFKDEADTRGRIVMSCMTPVTDGMRISIEDAEVRRFRAKVVEWLMTNHPHDCPVCDEGGECHLQDMTVMTGHTYRDYRFTKRTYVNQDLGPFINHEMNRCIQCYRCVRYYADYAGGRDLVPLASHNHVYFGRHQDGALESEFAGNLVEVCPTGVFTDKTAKMHYSRRWDLQTAPSICVHCGVGCNTSPGERYLSLRRIRNRYNGEVNGYFLCDRGRFGYEFVNSDNRIHVGSRRDGEQWTALSADETLAWVGARLKEAKGVVGIGSPRASLESNFALRTLVGAERFSQGLNKHELSLLNAIMRALQDGPARTPSLQDLGEADAALVLGEDVTNTAPMMALRLRQAARNAPAKKAGAMGIPDWNDAAVRTLLQGAKGPIYIAATCDTRLDDIATERYIQEPDELARLGFAVAHAIDSAAPKPVGLSSDAEALAGRIAQALLEAAQPVVVSGTSCGSEAVIQAAAQVAWALCRKGKPAALAYAVQECNTLGAALIGGAALEEAVDAVTRGEADTVVVVENDLYRRLPKARVDALFSAAKCVIALDHNMTPTVAQAHALLPAATFAESDGIFVNNEGRAQRFVQVYAPRDDTADSWRWLRRMRDAAGWGARGAWSSLDDIIALIAAEVPGLSKLPTLVPPADTRIVGQKIARQPHRYSGRTAMWANIDVSEKQIPQDPDSPLSFSMEGYRGRRVPTSLRPAYWAPGWNSPLAINKFQEEIGGSLKGGDPGLRVFEPREGAAAYALASAPSASRAGECLVVPLHHIYGSDEMSALSPPVASRAPEPYIALSPKDAHTLGVADGGCVELRLADAMLQFPAQIRAALPAGVVGVPAGLRGVAYAALPACGSIRKGGQSS